MIENISSPADVKKLSLSGLNQLAEEIRQLIIETVTPETGGHLASNLGVIELTIAIHKVFNSGNDIIIFDVSHQAYTHKLLTGRAKEFSTLRTMGGLSGYMDPRESLHDVCSMGHAGCGPTLALGLSIGGKYTVCVIGDGALTSGQAYEGLSNIIAHNPRNLMVILNDNGMSISKNVGWLTSWRERWFPQLRSQLELDNDFRTFEQITDRLAPKVPFGQAALGIGKGIKKTIDKAILPEVGQVWKEMGFDYLGPVNGHNIGELVEVISKARDRYEGVPFIHVITNKGNGHIEAQSNPTKYHQPSGGSGVTYSKAFCDALAELMREDQRIVALSAAMLEGTGLVTLRQEFGNRIIDVGICEQAAVSIAAGMAMAGLKPVVCIYSTFLQRAFDQIMHDVCLNDLPVVFAIDRAGLVGQDGKTHHGVYDLAYMRIPPNMILSVPLDKDELRNLLATALEQDHPFAIRYPRGAGLTPAPGNRFESIEVGSSRFLEMSRAAPEYDICLLGVGELTYLAYEARHILQKEDIMPAVSNLRFLKPISPEFIKMLTIYTDIVVIEEGTSQGGATAAILEQLAALNPRPQIMPRVHQISAGDSFIEHGSIEELRESVGLSVEGVVSKVKEIIDQRREHGSGAI